MSEFDSNKGEGGRGPIIVLDPPMETSRVCCADAEAERNEIASSSFTTPTHKKQKSFATKVVHSLEQTTEPQGICHMKTLQVLSMTSLAYVYASDMSRSIRDLEANVRQLCRENVNLSIGWKRENVSLT